MGHTPTHDRLTSGRSGTLRSGAIPSRIRRPTRAHDPRGRARSRARWACHMQYHDVMTLEPFEDGISGDDK
jgi:hypothetical protein